MADDEVEVTEAAPSDEFIPLSQSNYAWRPGVPIQQATFHVPRAGASVAELAAQALASERQLRERSRSRSPCPLAVRGDAGVMPARSAQSPESKPRQRAARMGQALRTLGHLQSLVLPLHLFLHRQ